MLKVQKILCPTDFSEASFEGLAKAVELAGGGATEICVVHVEPPVDTVRPMADSLSNALSEAERHVEVAKNLCEVVDERVPGHVRALSIVRQGNAAEEIVRMAREEGVDIIVLTTHGAGGLHTGSIGAVAEAVLSAATCPVLVICGPSRAMSAVSALKDQPSFETMLPEIKTTSSHKVYVDGD